MKEPNICQKQAVVVTPLKEVFSGKCRCNSFIRKSVVSGVKGLDTLSSGTAEWLGANRWGQSEGFESSMRQ